MTRWNLIILIHCFFAVARGHAQSDTTQKITEGRRNDPVQRTKPYVILISADGFRYDYAGKFNAVNLLRLSRQGTAADYMLSCYPSLTFPNHYSQATGMYPAHNGIVDNSFYDAQQQTTYNKNNRKTSEDGSWYGGIPLWVLAEQQKMLTACFYWAGSEADVAGVRPTYYYTYNEKIPMNKRLDAVRKWLLLPEERRPHLIMFYFPEVDHEGHEHGPEAPETVHAVHLVDESVGKISALTDSLHLPVNFVFVSDHGMTEVDTEHPLKVPSSLDATTCTISAGATLIHVFVKDPERIQEVYRKLKSEAVDFDVYLSTEVPPSWHYGKQDDRYQRVGDMIIVPRLHQVFGFNSQSPKPGAHGFDPAFPQMRASFYAWGPQIKKSGAIAPFENIHIYPFIAQILGLSYAHPIDGDIKVLGPLIKLKK